MLIKDKVIELINGMPESFSAEDLIERILLLKNIEEGLEHSKSGRTLTVKHAETKLKKWLK